MLASVLTLVAFFRLLDPATTEIYTLSLHDALPIWHRDRLGRIRVPGRPGHADRHRRAAGRRHRAVRERRSEEHTSELQSLRHLVCRLLLEKKKKRKKIYKYTDNNYTTSRSTLLHQA